MTCKLGGDPIGRLEAWERVVLRWQQRSGEVLSDSRQRGIVLMLLEDFPLKVHRVMNQARLDTWVKFRTELVEIRRAQQSAGMVGGGVQPVDVGSLPRDRGKGSGERCQICKKTGHSAKDCWHREKSSLSRN